MDSYWPDIDPYIYVFSSPVIYNDPSGMDPPIGLAMPCTTKPSGFAFSFKYGCYCGSAQVQNPKINIKPIDCIDKCCLDHDRCLDAHYGAGINGVGGICAHRCCDQGLEDCVEIEENTYLSFSCCKDSPIPDNCMKAGEILSTGFSIVNQIYAGSAGFFSGLLPNLAALCCPDCLDSSKYEKNITKFWKGRKN